MRVDALTGSGTIQSGYNAAGYQSFTFGVDNGSGNIQRCAGGQSRLRRPLREGRHGTQIPSGHNTYTGSTTIEDGVLLIMGDSSATGEYIVEAGATLGGTGKLSSVTVSGTLAPGTSPGLLTIEGDLTMDAEGHAADGDHRHGGRGV